MRDAFPFMDNPGLGLALAGRQCLAAKDRAGGTKVNAFYTGGRRPQLKAEGMFYGLNRWRH